MMDVYEAAKERSKLGDPEYVVCKGLDVVGVLRGEKLLKFLEDGYDISAYFVNGVAEGCWKIDDQRVIRTLLHVSNINLENIDTLHVYTQEFFEINGNTIYIYFVCIEKNKKPTTCYITPKSIHHPSYVDGQRTARKILDIISTENIKQDKERVIRLLRGNRKDGAE